MWVQVPLSELVYLLYSSAQHHNDKIFSLYFCIIFMLNLLNNSSLLIMDAAQPWGMDFQEMASVLGTGITNLHDVILYYLVLVLTLVVWMLSMIFFNFVRSSTGIRKSLIDITSTHGTAIELIWTILPAVILLCIAVPSFRLLYLMDEVIDPAATLKIIGRQWYWTYEYPIVNDDTMTNKSYDSYMIGDQDLNPGDLRLATVDMPLVVPVDAHIRLLTTSSDVIHSWAVPALGMKGDAIPGRINQLSLYVNRSGVYYGQCSELCGVNHAYMPTMVSAVSVQDYIQWTKSL